MCETQGSVWGTGDGEWGAKERKTQLSSEGAFSQQERETLSTLAHEKRVSKISFCQEEAVRTFSSPTLGHFWKHEGLELLFILNIKSAVLTTGLPVGLVCPELPAHPSDRGGCVVSALHRLSSISALDFQLPIWKVRMPRGGGITVE